MGGKHIRFDALVVIGDGKGHYGFGSSKSGEVPDAIKKSLTAAKKKLYTLHIAKGNTIAHPK
jgi:small subunit ribosomal protein S5